VARVGGGGNPPTANPDSATTIGTTPVAISVLANDTDPTGFLMPGSVTVTSGPSHGSVTVNPATGQVTYTAFAGFTGTDRFSYTATDNSGLTSDRATVTVGVGQAPPPVVRPGPSGPRSPSLLVFDPRTGGLEFVLRPYGRRYHKGIRAAVGDVNGDGVLDIITAAAHGHPAVLASAGRGGGVQQKLTPPRGSSKAGGRGGPAPLTGAGFAALLPLSRHNRRVVAQAFAGPGGAPLGA